jgi:VCBS repeat-containing protein
MLVWTKVDARPAARDSLYANAGKTRSRKTRRTNMNRRLTFLPIAISCVLAACSGGGGGGSKNPPPPPPPANTAPTFTTTSFNATEDTDLAAAVTATDAQSQAITFALVTSPANGTVTGFSASGTFIYLGAANFSGTDTFTVRATDSAGAQTTGTVTVTVAPVNDAPVIGGAAFTVAEDSELAGTMAASDVEGGAVTFALLGNPAHGTLVSLTPAGAFIYRPNPDYSGADAFTIRVTDSAGAFAEAVIGLTITVSDDVPTIRDDVLTASGNNPLIDVLANDTEPDGETLTLTLVGAPEFGTATVESGRIRLSLPAGFQGFNTLTYRAVDGAGAGATARALVFVDAQPVRFFYITNEVADYGRNIYVDDLLARRRVTSFDGTESTAIGQWMFVSTNGRTILFSERDNTGATSKTLYWVAIPADGSSGSRRINPAFSASQSSEETPDMSPDGRWAVYRVRDSNLFTERFYLADLTGSAAPREIVAPAGTSRIDTEADVMFDDLSQYFYLTVNVPLAGGQTGATVYRAPLADPSALQPFFSPAVAGRSVYVAYVEPDGSRAVVITYEESATRLYLARASDPANPLPISPAVVYPAFMMGSYRADWEHNRVLFNIDSTPGITPYTCTIHTANLATGNWTALGSLPADFTRPEIWEVHPAGASALVTTAVNDPVTGIATEVREVDLVAGAPSRLVISNNFGGRSQMYTNAGNSILLADMAGLLLAPRNDLANQKPLFTQGVMSNYRFAPDGKIISISAGTTSSFDTDSIWAVNQTSAAGTFTRRLAQVTGRSFSYVSVGSVAPRYGP